MVLGKDQRKLEHLILSGSKGVPKTDRDMSEEHMSPLDGTPSGQTGDYLSIGRNNDNNEL